MQRVHATAVAIGQPAQPISAVLLTGPPGAGKSDLALRLIDRGGVLVADDQVELQAEAGLLIARPPAAIAGMLEVRGLGLIRLPFAASARVVLLCDLAEPPERLPDPVYRTLSGIAVPAIAVAPFAASAPLIVERAVALALGSALWTNDGAG